MGRRTQEKLKRREKRKARRERRNTRVRESVVPAVMLSDPYIGEDGSVKFDTFIAADLPEPERERIMQHLRNVAAEDGATVEERGIVTVTADDSERE